MKLDTVVNKTRVSNTGRSQRVGILEQNAHLLEDILRNKIYSNKPQAVVREYLTNAIDEHKFHNISRPVEVTLDEGENPFFCVRDFAKGLDEEGVFNVFAMYCASTKNNDDRNMGGYGIGSKAGYAYGDQFYVTSHHGGKKITYLFALQVVDGIKQGMVHKVQETESKETGIEVKVPVKKQDIYSFRQLIKYFTAFVSIPVLVNGEEQEKEEFPFSGDFWWYNNNATPVVVVGEIAYPIPQNWNRHISIRVGVDEVNIAVSREAIEITEKTTKTLNEKINKAEEELSKKIQDSLGRNITDFWDYFEKLSALPHDLKRNCERIVPPHFYHKYFSSKKSVTEYHERVPKKDSFIYHRIGSEKAPRGFYEHVTNNGSHFVYIKKWETKEEMEKAFSDPKKAWMYLPKHQTTKVSDVIVPKSIKLTKKNTVSKSFLETFGAKTEQNYKFRLQTFSYKYEKDRAEKAFNNGGYYFLTERGTNIRELQSVIFHFNCQNIDFWKTINLQNIVIFGVMSSGIKKFKKAPQWKNISELKNLFTDKDIERARQNYFASYSLRYHKDISVKSRLFFTDLIPTKTEEHLIKISKRPVSLSLSDDFKRNIMHGLTSHFEKRQKRILTKFPESVYSYVGSQLLFYNRNDLQVVEEQRKKLKDKINDCSY